MRAGGSSIARVPATGPVRGRRATAALAGRPANFVQQRLGFRRRRGVEHFGQHGTASVIGLNGHAAFALSGVRAHQRTPCLFMRAVDLQQPPRRRNDSAGVSLLAQQRLGHAAGTVAQAFPLRGQPHVERGIDPVQIFEQFAVQQRQRGGPAVAARMISSTSTQTARAQRQLIARDVQDFGFRRRQRPQQQLDFLP